MVAENARLHQQVAELTAQLEAALAEIKRLKRAGKRQATPFAKHQTVKDPQPPGRSEYWKPSSRSAKLAAFQPLKRANQLRLEVVGAYEPTYRA